MPLLSLMQKHGTTQDIFSITTLNQRTLNEFLLTKINARFQNLRVILHQLKHRTK